MTHNPSANLLFAPIPVRLSKAALAALVLGILAIVPLGPLAALPGIILSIVGMKATAGPQPQLRGFGLALAGLITSLVGLVFWGVILLLIALLIPSISRAREMSMRVADASSLRTLSHACLMYSADNRGDFPPILYEASAYLPSPKVLKSKFSNTPELTSLPASAADFDANSDWVYVGADLTARIPRPSQVILLYSKPSTPLGRNIAFADGSVQWVNASDLTQVFNRSNDTRTTYGLPPLYMDGPPPSPPLRRRPSPSMGSPRANLGEDPSNPIYSPLPFEYTINQAIADIRSSNTNIQRKGLEFLRSKKIEDASSDNHKKIAAALENPLAAPENQLNALRLLRTWALPENVPALLKIMAKHNPADLQQAGYVIMAIEALATTKDTTVARPVAVYLAYSTTRDAASNALISLGPDVEAEAWPYLLHYNYLTARSACSVLAKIGTPKSLPALRETLTTKTEFVKEQAQSAIDAIHARANPDDKTKS